ncbi:MAG: hypothetical protein ACLU3I_11550 [Acutalibacteraceae bacterium]
MKVRLNEDKEVVARVKEGLKRTGGYCPCRLARTEENKCMCRSSASRSPTPTLRATATVCSTIRKIALTRLRVADAGLILRADRVVRSLLADDETGPLLPVEPLVTAPVSPFAMILAKRKSAFGVMEPSGSFASGSMRAQAELTSAGPLVGVSETPNAPGQRAFLRCAASFFLEIRQYSCEKCLAQRKNPRCRSHHGFSDTP